MSSFNVKWEKNVWGSREKYCKRAEARPWVENVQDDPEFAMAAMGIVLYLGVSLVSCSTLHLHFQVLWLAYDVEGSLGAFDRTLLSDRRS